MTDEFSLIERYLRRPTHRADVPLAGGDDAALVEVPADSLLVVTTDTLVADVHFEAAAPAAAIGHKALAVNLSDLAAMGATPAWVSLALTLPAAEPSAWLADFAEGFYALADAAGVALIGGDLTHGPLSVCVQALGLLPTAAKPLRRNGANVGDLICVTGTLGDAALALARSLGGATAPADADAAFLQQRLQQPWPRLAAGPALRPLASAGIDVSDGLIADLGHICRASGVGAIVEEGRLPLSAAARATAGAAGLNMLEAALYGGDDYELCVTVPPAALAAAQRAVAASEFLGLTPIGRIVAEPGIRLQGVDGALHAPHAQVGYRHFD